MNYIQLQYVGYSPMMLISLSSDRYISLRTCATIPSCFIPPHLQSSRSPFGDVPTFASAVRKSKS